MAAQLVDELVLSFPGVRRASFGIEAETKAHMAASAACNLAVADHEHAPSTPIASSERMTKVIRLGPGLAFTGNVKWGLFIEKLVSHSQEIVVADLQSFAHIVVQMGILNDVNIGPGVMVPVRSSL